MMTYYARHREARLGYQRAYELRKRRAAGVAPRKARLTEEERLAIVRQCRECGAQVHTRSLLLACQNICWRCRNAKRPESQARKNCRTAKAQRAKVARMRAIKKSGCVRCGYTGSPRNLDFHHRDPATKLFRLADAGRWSTAKVVAEMAKCEVLCRWCHEKEHAA